MFIPSRPTELEQPDQGNWRERSHSRNQGAHARGMFMAACGMGHSKPTVTAQAASPSLAPTQQARSAQKECHGQQLAPSTSMHGDCKVPAWRWPTPQSYKHPTGTSPEAGYHIDSRVHGVFYLISSGFPVGSHLHQCDDLLHEPSWLGGYYLDRWPLYAHSPGRSGYGFWLSLPSKHQLLTLVGDCLHSISNYMPSPGSVISWWSCFPLAIAHP